jgi:hypothetical protein
MGRAVPVEVRHLGNNRNRHCALLTIVIEKPIVSMAVLPISTGQSATIDILWYSHAAIVNLASVPDACARTRTGFISSSCSPAAIRSEAARSRRALCRAATHAPNIPSLGARPDSSGIGVVEK